MLYSSTKGCTELQQFVQYRESAIAVSHDKLMQVRPKLAGNAIQLDSVACAEVDEIYHLTSSNHSIASVTVCQHIILPVIMYSK